MSTGITEKISRLLALAASPYEAEARAALLKARQLMVEHKLSPEDIIPPERQRVVKESTGVTSTKMSSPWAVQLSAIIGEYYCCRHYILNIKGRKIHEIGFVGFEDDYKVCKMVYRYAFESVMSRCADIKKQRGYSAAVLRQMCNSYGWGFCQGLQAAFKAQSAQHQEWGLVMVIPKPVQDVVEGMKKATYARPSTNSLHRNYANMGYVDGQKFDVSHRIDKTGRETGPDKLAVG